MKLRSVNIQGFKSFRDRTTVELSDGMTAIVGPNGCGKSNVVDAIKWAMGDMSPKSLRGDSMSDLIFAGSADHKPMGLAEVTLTFENEMAGDVASSDDGDEAAYEEASTAEEPRADGADEREESDADEGTDVGVGFHTDVDADWGDSIPREFQNMAEISVTRRLHRSGESEYLINKTKCRLRDIRDLLAGTGLGKQGYSIIEQNRVGFIVSAKPDERRLIIEEASGITRYKSQRKRAERRLTRAEENLQRVNDIYREVSKQIRTLERQAKRAAEYRELSAELRTLEIALLFSRRDELQRSRKKVTEKLEETTETLEEARKSIKTHEDDLNSARVDAFQWEKKHQDATEAYYRLDTRLNLARSRKEHAESSVKETQERLKTAREERKNQIERRRKLEAELKHVDAELDRFEGWREAEEDLAAREKRLREVRERVRRVESERDDLRRRLEDAVAQLRRLEDRREFTRTRKAELERREEELESAIAEAGTEVDALEKTVEELEADVEHIRERVEETELKRREATTALEATRGELETASERLEETRARRIDLSARVESLAAMQRRGEGYGDAVRGVVDWAEENQRSDIFGPLGDYVSVSEENERAVAAYLGHEVEDIVVTSRTAATEALDALGEEEKGRVGFRVSGARDESGVRDFVARLLDRLTFVDGVDEVPDAMGDPRAAWALADGRVFFGNGRVVGGDAEAEGEVLLRQRRVLRELESEMAEVSQDEEELVEVVDQLKSAVAEAEDEVAERREAHETTALKLRETESELNSQRRELERAEKSVGRFQAELIPVFKAQEELSSETEGFAEKREDLEGVRDRHRELLEETNGRLEEAKEALEELQSEVTTEKVRLAEARERERNLEETQERLSRSLEDAEDLISKYRREAEEQIARIEELETTIASNEAEVERANKELKTSRKKVENAKEKLAAANERLDAIEQKMRVKRQRIEELVATLQELELSDRESTLGLEHVDEQLSERFEVTHQEAERVAETVETPPEGRKGRRDYLRSRIEKMGPVNAMAEDEYEEAKEREEFLTEQKDDLEQSVADLREAIERMDQESRRRFEETYEAVNERFQNVFPRLFRGGRAELILTDPDDMLNTGVDIQVQPPGKRLQSVSLLSGGEKALTAVSLIFSIFMLKPTPFSILDEVDAPLDEANVGRFAEMVRELSETSQMLLITHNRRTMESADVLYGVTMEDAGVSKMVSVKLSEVDDRLAS